MSSGVTPVPRPWRRSGPVCFETTTFDVTRRRLRDGRLDVYRKEFAEIVDTTIQTLSHYQTIFTPASKGLVLRARARI
jgi:hypothetical protein